MEEDVVRLSKARTDIAVITFSRPRRANAMNQAVLKHLGDICAEIRGDQTIKCAVITGEGKIFSSGFDLQEQAEAQPEGVDEWEKLLKADFDGIMSCWDLPVPTVAAVRGGALAGGFELMLACDLSVAAENAVFGEPELKFGAGIVSLLLPWFVGPKVAKEIIYLGLDSISAREAHRLGLVNRVVDDEAVMETALNLAKAIASKDDMVVRRTKRAINQTYEIMGLRQALQSNLDVDLQIEGQGSKVKQQFLTLIREKGLRAALAWREQQTNDP